MLNRGRSLRLALAVLLMLMVAWAALAAPPTPREQDASATPAARPAPAAAAATGSSGPIHLPAVLSDYAGWPVHISDPIPARGAAYRGEVFQTVTVRIPRRVPAGGRFYVSSRPSLVAAVMVDDEIAVLLDGEEVFVYRFSSDVTRPRPAIVRIDRAIVERIAGRTVAVEYRDVYAAIVEATDVWLMWVPEEAPTPTETPTATPTPPHSPILPDV